MLFTPQQLIGLPHPWAIVGTKQQLSNTKVIFFGLFTKFSETFLERSTL